ncbi:MAG TPA: AGE family epimerase/isomerase [Anaerolineae bacterium]|nr:AGE family epimerase/isomerase [Anaerolineae bacterium]
MDDFSQRIEHELRQDILPFWMEHTLDEVNGGFYGALSNDLHIDNTVPRSAVLCARILWTYSMAYRVYQDDRYLLMARRAYDYLTQKFWDQEYGGVYWTIDPQGHPNNDRKHVYAQAFALYGLAEFYRATNHSLALLLAEELFHLIEAHTFDAVNGGNVECRSREWGLLDDMRLSANEPDCAKSMNTLLHLMEAYTNLLRVWPDQELKAKQRGLIEIFLRHVVDPQTQHFRLFFDETWHSLNGHISPGHDIEGSWLLVEAAEVQGDAELLTQARYNAVLMAEAVYRDGVGADGTVLNEVTPQGVKNFDKHWWPQAEGVVGFTNAYQLSGRAEFAQAADRLWNLIETLFVDRTNGDWFKVLDPNGVPLPHYHKAGPWECPYHHSRACFEMLARLGAEVKA